MLDRFHHKSGTVWKMLKNICLPKAPRKKASKAHRFLVETQRVNACNLLAANTSALGTSHDVPSMAVFLRIWIMQEV
jgi:hypothetical protein